MVWLHGATHLLHQLASQKQEHRSGRLRHCKYFSSHSVSERTENRRGKSKVNAGLPASLTLVFGQKTNFWIWSSTRIGLHEPWAECLRDKLSWSNLSNTYQIINTWLPVIGNLLLKYLNRQEQFFQSMCNQNSDSGDHFVKRVAFNYGQPWINDENPTLQGISCFAERCSTLLVWRTSGELEAFLCEVSKDLNSSDL